MSHESEIISHLLKGKSITQWEAIHKFRCLRLSARIYDLKRIGYKIKTVMVEKDKKRFAKYFIPKGDLRNGK